MKTPLTFRVRQLNNVQLVGEYSAIIEHITQYIRDEGRAPFWMMSDKTVLEVEMLRRMK